MIKLKELIKSPHIHVALSTGFSIIVMAYFSKRILPEPIGYVSLAIPPFIAMIVEALIGKHKDRQVLISRFGIVAILIATALVIILSAV